MFHAPPTPSSSDFLFPLQPPPSPGRQTPGGPTREGLISVHFGSISAPFGSRFGSVSGPFGSVSGLFRGPFRGVGWGRGRVGERGFCKGKEYHYPRQTPVLTRTEGSFSYPGGFSKGGLGTRQ